MKLDMLFLLSASSAFMFLARDAFAIPVPYAAASYHHVKRMENFEPVFNGILNRVEGAARGPVRLLADGDDAIHAGRSLTLAQTPHSLAQPFRPPVMQHAWNDAPYFWTSPARPHTLAHPYGEPDVTVTRPHMHVASTSMVGHNHPFALEGGRSDPGGRRSQDGAASVRSNDERLVRQQGDQHVAGPSTRPISTIEELKTLTNDKLLGEGERLLGEAFARVVPVSNHWNAFQVGKADALLKAWLLEVFRRRIDRVDSGIQETFRRVHWRFVGDPSVAAGRISSYKKITGWPNSMSKLEDTPVAHGPFDERNIDNPLNPFDIANFRCHVVQRHRSGLFGVDTSNRNNIHVFFSVRDKPGQGVVSFGNLVVEAAPSRGNIPDVPVSQ